MKNKKIKELGIIDLEIGGECAILFNPWKRMVTAGNGTRDSFFIVFCQKILLLSLIVIYSALLNAQTCQPTLKPGDTVGIVIDGKKRDVVIENEIHEILVSELKVPTSKLMPDLSWESVLDVMDLVYDSTVGLQLNRKFEFCKPYSLSLYNSLKSSDDNFIVYMEHYFTGVSPPLFTCDENWPDTVVSAYNKYFNNLMNHYSGIKNDYLTRISKDKRNIRHFYIIRDHLIDIAEKYDKEYRDQFSMSDLKKHVYYFPDSYAQTKFNADTAISYVLPVKAVNGNRRFPKKYSRCEVLALQKKDTGPVFFYCFFTDTGYKKRNDYMEKLGKTIKFKD
jgi:hypothetical protein